MTAPFISDSPKF